MLWKTFGKKSDQYFGQMNIWHDIFENNDKTIPIQHDSYRVKSSLSIHFILNGKGYIGTEKGKELLKKGDAFLVFPGNVCYYADKNDPWEYCGISISGNSFIKEFASSCNQETRSLPDCEEVKVIGGLIKEAVFKESKEKEHEKKIKSVWYDIMSLLCLEEISEEKTGNAYLKGAVAYIREHYSDRSLYISDVAKAVGVSHSYLCRIFSSSKYGSPERLLVDTRLDEAANMLKNTNERINEISWACGYCDPVNFGKSFRKKFGMTPQEYRKG